MKKFLKFILGLLTISVAFLVFLIGKYVAEYYDYFPKHNVRKP